MRRSVFTVRSDQTVLEAARLMRDRQVGMLPVFVGDEVVGVLTDRDVVVRVVAHGHDPAAAPVGDVMTRPVVGCTANASPEEAAATMAQANVSRLLVWGPDGRGVEGIVSFADLGWGHEEKSLPGELAEELSRPSRPA